MTALIDIQAKLLQSRFSPTDAQLVTTETISVETYLKAGIAAMRGVGVKKIELDVRDRPDYWNAHQIQIYGSTTQEVDGTTPRYIVSPVLLFDKHDSPADQILYKFQTLLNEIE